MLSELIKGKLSKHWLEGPYLGVDDDGNFELFTICSKHDSRETVKTAKTLEELFEEIKQ